MRATKAATGGQMQRTPRLRALRERAALSQEDLAERSNVARATIADLEGGKRPARPSTIRKLAKGLGVEVTELYGDPEYPLVEAPPFQRSFNHLLAEERRRAFIERARRYVEARVAHYEKRLAEAERGGLFAGYQGARALRDDALDEHLQLSDLLNGEILERWLENPEVPEDVKENLGRALVEIMQPMVAVVGRISGREWELAESVEEKAEAERAQAEIRQRTEEIA
jgi:transcriptional regulator with XRE-family HTH domain